MLHELLDQIVQRVRDDRAVQMAEVKLCGRVDNGEHGFKARAGELKADLCLASTGVCQDMYCLLTQLWFPV